MAKRDHRADLAVRERRNNLAIERRERMRAEAMAIAEGVGETVALESARGAEFVAPIVRRGERAKPIRRMTGLEWLRSKGRIDEAQLEAGEDYGKLFRRVYSPASIRSCVDNSVRLGIGRELPAILAYAEGTEVARGKLEDMRLVLCRERLMVAACDLICGAQLTPREATPNGVEAAKAETALLVALSILAASKSPLTPGAV